MGKGGKPGKWVERKKFFLVTTDAKGEGRMSIVPCLRDDKQAVRVIERGELIYHDNWICIKNDFEEKDAKTYVRMNWKCMTPKSVAVGLRDCHPKFKDLTDEEFEALYYHQTIEEFEAGKEAFLAEEKVKDDAKEAKEKARMEEARQAAIKEKEEKDAAKALENGDAPPAKENGTAPAKTAVPPPPAV